MITSLQNQWVKHVSQLQQRKARNVTKAFVIEGWRFVSEALARGAQIKQAFFTPEYVREQGDALLANLRLTGTPVEEVDRRVMEKMSATEAPQGILAVVAQPEFSWADVRCTPDAVLLIIDGIQDPGNLGTILRTALAAGVQAVCTTRGTVDLYNPKVLRSTMGAIFSLVLLPDLRAEEILDFLREKDCSLVVADVQGEPLYRSGPLSLPLALVVGNEGSGPTLIFKQEANRWVTIPMQQQVESLNAAMAVGIILYEVVRQRDFL